jgi:hypothetical protein
LFITKIGISGQIFHRWNIGERYWQATFQFLGELVFSTLLGGVTIDSVADLAVHTDGSVALTGSVTPPLLVSLGFPVLNQIKSSVSGLLDATVAVLDADGT